MSSNSPEDKKKSDELVGQCLPLLLAKQNISYAQQLLAQAVCLDQENRQALFIFGYSFLLTGDNENAKIIFSKYIDDFCDVCTTDEYIGAYNYLGNALMNQELYDDARDCFDICLGANNNYIPALQNLGYCLVKQKQDARLAEDCLLRVLDQQPDNAQTIMIYTQLLMDGQRYAEAIKVMERMPGGMVTDIKMARAYGHCLRSMGYACAPDPSVN